MSSARAGAAMATSVGCFQGDSGVEFIYGEGGGSYRAAQGFVVGANSILKTELEIC
jgi:hypothetical protein